MEIAQRYELDRVYNGETSGWQSLEEIERSEHEFGRQVNAQAGKVETGSRTLFEDVTTSDVGERGCCRR